MSAPYPSPGWRRWSLLLACVAGAWGVLPASRAAEARLFEPSEMTEVRLDGLSVRLGHPVQVTAQLGWIMGYPGPRLDSPEIWSFIHLTPYLARFPGGNLVATYAMDPDTQKNPFFVSGFQISRDGGAHWGRRYATLMQHIPMVFIPKENDSLLAVASELLETAPGERHSLTGPAYLFEHGGDRVTLLPDAVRVLDWPWPLEPRANPQPESNWHSGLAITGTALKVGPRLLATAYGRIQGSRFDSSMLIASDDGGYTWRYYSTIAGPDLSLPLAMGREDPADAASVALVKKIESEGVSEAAVAPLAVRIGYEGANETSVLALASGELMAVYRVGGGSLRKWSLRRRYSRDGGRSWSAAEALPAWSVMPEMVRTANGAIALSTGRPGVYLWLSADPRGRRWQKIDLVAHHNAWAPDPALRIGTLTFKSPPFAPERAGKTKSESTSYTAMVEVAPNRLLLIYDRDPEQAALDPKEVSRVFVLPIEIEKP